MLTFVTTIRHPDNCSSYNRVGRLLDASLRSVCRQTDDDFRIVVVHNSMAPVGVSDSRISYVQVEFPAPSKEQTARIDFSLFRHDKGTKCVIGALAARELGADHVMFFDADDLMHHALAALANDRPEHPGWYSPQGWVHTHGSRSIQFMPSDFHHKNGSTSIIRADLLGLSSVLSTGSSQQQIIEAMTQEYVHRMFGEHGWWDELLAESGHLMEALPFPAAVWEIGTGENHSGNLRSGREHQAIDQMITQEFGLKPTPWPTNLAVHARVSARRVMRRIGR